MPGVRNLASPVDELAREGPPRSSRARLAELLRVGATNLLLRGLTLAAKLLFLVLAARHLAVQDMAIYGLMATTVGIAVTLTGLEFYAFSIREILASHGPEQTIRMRDQLVFHGAAYLLLVPLALPVFAAGILPWSLLGWFVVLAIGEHLSQEVTRILNALFRPLLATVLFFIRSSAWALIIALLWLWRPQLVTVGAIFAAWSVGIVVSLGFAAYTFSRLDWQLIRRPINWRWIGRGVVVAAPFLVSAISYRITEMADRYILHFLTDDRVVGVYSFYGTVANALPALLSATLSAILVPRVIHAWQAGDYPSYRRSMHSLTTGTVAVVALTAPLVYFAIAWLQPYLGKPEYASGMPTFAVLLLAAAVSAAAQVPGVVLYARHQDMVLLLAVLLSAVTNTVLNFLLIPSMGMLGAAWATVLAYAAMGVFQLLHILRSSPARAQ
jgi:O-antigen/teichoic acid export membrane protein